MGWSASPSTWTTNGRTFFDLSPWVWMITPQLTEQYGQVDRVSVVREIFSARDSAHAGVMSNPSSVAPAAPTLRKSLRVVDIQGPPPATGDWLRSTVMN